MTFNFYGLGRGACPHSFILVVFSFLSFSTELGLDLWRHFSENAVASLTAINDFEGLLTRFCLSMAIRLGESRRLLESIQACRVRLGRWRGVLSAVIEWHGTGCSFRFRFMSTTSGKAV